LTKSNIYTNIKVIYFFGGDWLKNRLIAFSCALFFVLNSVGCNQISQSSDDSNSSLSDLGSSSVLDSDNSSGNSLSSQDDSYADSDFSSLSDDTSSDTSGDDSETTSVAATTAQTTTTKQTQTTPPATTTTAATTTAAPPPVVIPWVRTPTSPGTEAYSSSNAVIDVSNKSEGYFTARYTGTNSKVKVLVNKDGVSYSYDLNTSGTTEVFPLQLGNGTYTITIGELVSGTSYAVSIQQSVSVSLSSSLSPFLYPNQQVNFSQNSALVQKSAEVCAGKTTALEKIGAIFTYITSNIRYDYNEANAIISGTLTFYIPYPDEVLSTNMGICYDYASLFAAMARAQGIPTKLVKGYASPQGLYHAWNQVYTAETGWITVDIQLVNSGFNTLDATFYASASNKASVVSYFNDTGYYKVDKVF